MGWLSVGAGVESTISVFDAQVKEVEGAVGLLFRGELDGGVLLVEVIKELLDLVLPFKS